MNAGRESVKDQKSGVRSRFFGGKRAEPFAEMSDKAPYTTSSYTGECTALLYVTTLIWE